MDNQLSVKLVLIFSLLLLTVEANAQQTVVTGTVTDAQTGNTLPGANVLVKGTSMGTATDSDGHYTLAVPSLHDTLRVSFIGYKTKRVPINGRTTINIAMIPQVLSGQQLVVVGYGTQQKKYVTGSIAQISSSQFNSGEISKSARLIQGKVPGLKISKVGSNPNSDYTIRIRGLSTLGTDTGPLIVIDGVPGGSLDNIDPSNIASISVLKSASASAIYGTRGANGVIIVNTKTASALGRKPQFNVEYKGVIGITKPFRRVKAMNASQYRKFLKYYGQEIGEDLSSLDLGHSTDWYDKISRTGYNQHHYLSFSGGNSSTTYRVALNFRDEKGILKNTGFDKIGTRVNLKQSAINNKLTFNVHLTANRITRNIISSGQAGSIFSQAILANPTAPVKDPNAPKLGYYFQLRNVGWSNPVAAVELGSHDKRGIFLKGDVKGEYTFTDYIPGLSVTGLFSQKNYKSSVGIFSPSTAGFTHIASASRSQGNNRSRLIQTTVHYKKSVSSQFHFELLGGYSWQKFTSNGFNMSGSHIIGDHLGYNNMGAVLSFKRGNGSVGSYKGSHKLIAGFGRLNLRYQNTYLLSGSVRREGSTRFGKNNKWGTFYSVSGGIRLANLFNIANVQRLKLRAGYGVTGNIPPANNLSKLILAPKGFFFYHNKYLPAYGPANNPNPYLHWEKKEEINIGIDFSLLDNRLSGSLDLYSNKTKGALVDFTVPVPPNLYPTEWINIGELANKGLEAQININVIQSQNFLWNTTLLGARHLRTKLVSLSSKNLKFANQKIIQILGSPGLHTRVIRVKEGKPIGQIWGPVFQGITDDGHWNLKDLNGDGIIDNQDNTVIGEGLPTFTASWNNSFQYKNWSLRFSFQGTFGHDLLNTYRAFYEVPSVALSRDVLQSTWNVKNLVDAAKFSSFYVENASFVKLSNASLSYTFPLPDATSLRSLTLQVSGVNLFLITSYSGPDPSPSYIDDEPYRTGPTPLAPGIDRRTSWFNARKWAFSVDFKF